MWTKRTVGVELTAPGSTVQLSRVNWLSAAQLALFLSFAFVAMYGYVAAIYAPDSEVYPFVWMTYILMPLQGLLVLGQIAASAYFHALVRVNRPDPSGSSMTPVRVGTPMMSALGASVWWSTGAYVALLTLHVIYTLRNSGDVSTDATGADSNYPYSVVLLVFWSTIGFCKLGGALGVHWAGIVTVTAWKSKN